MSFLESTQASDQMLAIERKMSQNSARSNDSASGDESTPIQLIADRIPFEDFASCDLRLRIYEVESKLFHRTRFSIEVQSERFPTKIVQRMREDFDLIHRAITFNIPSLDLPDLPRKLVISKKKRQEAYENILMKIVEASNTSSLRHVSTIIRRYLYNFLFSIEGKYKAQDTVQDQAVTQKISKDNEIESIQFSPTRIKEPSYFERSDNQVFEGLHVSKPSKGEEEFGQLNADQQQVIDQMEIYNRQDQVKEKGSTSRFLLQKKPAKVDEMRKDGYFMINLNGSEKVFNKYYAQIWTQNIYIFSLNSQNQFEYAIPCSSLQLGSVKNAVDTITLGHRYDKHQVEMKSMNDPTGSQIKSISDELRSIVEKLPNKKTTGKIILEVREAKISSVVESGTFHIVIRHLHTEIELSKKQSQDSNISWRQKILLPLFDNYSEIEIELYRTSSPTRILKQSKEELIGTAVILVADIQRNISSYPTFIIQANFKLPLKHQQQLQAQNQSQSQHPQNGKNPGEDQDQVSRIAIQITDFSNLQSYFAVRGSEEKYENKVLHKDKYEPKERLEFKMTKNRVKRLKTLATINLKSFNDILNFKYPRLSYLAYFIMLVLILTFNMNYLVNYLLLLFILATALNHKSFSSTFLLKVGKLQAFFAQLNLLYYPRQIETIEEFEMQKMLDPKQVTSIQHEGILSKVKKYYKQLGYMNYASFQVISFIEKFKNLTTWTHYQKTYFSLLASLIAIFLYIIIPFNVVFALLLIKRCLQGKQFYSQTKAHNLKIVSRFVKEVIDKYFKEYLENVKYRDKEWISNYSFASFKKTMAEQITLHLKFKVDEENLLKHCRTFNQLCSYLASAHHKILFDKSILKDFPAIQYSTSYFAKRSPVKRALTYIYYFLYNIPSDQYRILHQGHM